MLCFFVAQNCSLLPFSTELLTKHLDGLWTPDDPTACRSHDLIVPATTRTSLRLTPSTLLLGFTLTNKYLLSACVKYRVSCTYKRTMTMGFAGLCNNQLCLDRRCFKVINRPIDSATSSSNPHLTNAKPTDTRYYH